MLFCPRCNKKMNKVMHFEKNKNFQFYQCKNCHFETDHKKLVLNDKLYNK